MQTQNNTTMSTTIKHGKILSVITGNKVSTHKISAFSTVIEGLESFALQTNNTTAKRMTAKAEALGFTGEIRQGWGFEWEVFIDFKKTAA